MWILFGTKNRYTQPISLNEIRVTRALHNIYNITIEARKNKNDKIVVNRHSDDLSNQVLQRKFTAHNKFKIKKIKWNNLMNELMADREGRGKDRKKERVKKGKK